ncbi:MAG: SGNH/GDSL hydrolase family protein [bacterium]|nr:SGNH/GDSL hydrolase family protein [bacterium]MDT8365292.1 SGNH/GDSL hydrolase family protein [bacterium]
MKNILVRRTFLAILWLLFLFILLQAAGFVLFTFTDARFIGSYGYPAGLYVHHPSLGYLYTPGFQGRFVGGSYNDIELRINETGFRDGPFLTGSGARRRIAVVGDSVVFGAGVREEDRFTDLLGEDDRVKDAGIEFLNMGVNFYTFGHYLALAKLGFMGIEPDLVFVGFTLNDIRTKGGEPPERRLVKGGSVENSKGTKGWFFKPQWLSKIQQALDRTYAGKLVEYVRDLVKVLGTSEEEMKNYHTRWMRSVVEYWSITPNRERLRGEIRAFKVDDGPAWDLLCLCDLSRAQ